MSQSKKTSWLLSALILFLGFGSLACNDVRAAPKELVVYTYDSLVAKGGLGAKIFPLFEKQCQCKLRALASGDAVQMINRVELDSKRNKSTAHVMLGLDQNLWLRAKPFTEDWGSWKPEGLAELTPITKMEAGFLPFDYGVFAMIADTKTLKAKGIALPKNLTDLLASTLKRGLILEDPRTSTPGLAFLLFTHEILGRNVWKFWKKLRSQWLTLPPGWDQAYGLFVKGEAPLVWSYKTSQAYHEEHGDQEGRYKALVFEEGAPIQIEGAAILKSVCSPGKEDSETCGLAKSFLTFLISEETQRLIPKGNWMMPVRLGIELPASFLKLPITTKTTHVSVSDEESQKILQEWAKAIQ